MNIKYPPSPNLNVCAKKNFSVLRKVLSKKENPLILIIGSGDKPGKGVEYLGHKDKIINLDINHDYNVDIVGDALSLPFLDEKFDLVVVQAVLEHVKDPNKAVKEIFRVLKDNGYIYSEIPFFQSVHGDPHDYQRYTLEGNKELFRDFKELRKGIAGGPTTAFNHVMINWLSLLLSFNSKFIFSFNRTIFGWIFFPLRYLDLLLYRFKGAEYIAGGFYFIGKK